jgi:cytoskeleton protein RodZ
MESIGEKLRQTREDKSITIEQVARETNIAKNYLEALEAEDFEAFPGEPYLLGFLRNYSEFLGLDPSESVTLYKNFRLQEQPVPMNELLEKKPPVWLIPAIGIFALAVIIVIAGISIIPMISNAFAEQRARQEEMKSQQEVNQSKEYNFSGELEEVFFEDDSVLFSEGRKISVRAVGTFITLQVGSDSISMRPGEYEELDYAESEDKIVAVEVLEAFLENDDNPSVKIRFEERDPATELETPVNLGSAGSVQREEDPIVILTKDSPEPFRMDVVFQAPSLVRSLIDGDLRSEKYYQKNETIRFEVNRQAQFWLSNAGAFRGKIEQNNVDFGEAGVVSAKLMRWVRNTDTGKYDLVIYPVY